MTGAVFDKVREWKNRSLDQISLWFFGGPRMRVTSLFKPSTVGKSSQILLTKVDTAKAQ